MKPVGADSDGAGIAEGKGMLYAGRSTESYMADHAAEDISAGGSSDRSGYEKKQ